MQRISVKSIVGILALLGASASVLSVAQEFTSFSSLAAQDRGSFKPLSQQQAFPYVVSELGEKRLLVSWQPAAEHYLYKRGFKFTYHSASSDDPITIEFVLPDGLEKNDEFFGAVEVYYNSVAATLELPQLPSNDAFIVIEYQGCADWGFCYPPQSERFSF